MGYGQEQDHQGPIYLGPQQPDSPVAPGHYKGPCHASHPPAFPPVSPQVWTAGSPSEGSARASVAAGKDDDSEGRTERVCWRAIGSNLRRDPPELQHLGLQEDAGLGRVETQTPACRPPEHSRCNYRYKGPRGLKDLNKRCCQQPLLGRPLWCPQYPEGTS